MNETEPSAQMIIERTVEKIRQADQDRFDLLKEIFTVLFQQAIITPDQLDANRFKFVFDIIYDYENDDMYQPVIKELLIIFDHLKPLQEELGNQTYLYLKQIFDI